MNQRTSIEWTPYKAIEYAEGFGEGEESTTEEVLEAWAYIISNEMYINLQGWYGRQVNNIIESGFISSEGEINWEKVDELTSDEYE